MLVKWEIIFINKIFETCIAHLDLVKATNSAIIKLLI